MRLLSSITFLLAAVSAPAASEALVLEGTADDSSVQVRGMVAGETQPRFHAIWRFTDDGIQFDLVNTMQPDGTAGLRMDRLMEAALGAFLDKNIHFQKEGVVADDTPDRLLNFMNAMAWAAEEHFGASGSFAGFEASTRDQLIRLCTIDWSKAQKTAIGDDNDKYLAIYFFVRSQRMELERQLRADLLPLSAIDVLAPPSTKLTPGQREKINSLCGTVFDEHNFLCALDLAVSDSSTALPDTHMSREIMATLRALPASIAPSPAPPPRIRKRDQWLKAELDAINQRIDRMDQRQELWALRDRIDDLQGQMDDLRVTVQDIEVEREKEAEPNPIAALSELTGQDVTIRFERYSSEIGGEYLLALNEVFEQLARSPQDRVLITGYTDRSGDPAANLALSEQRAKAVRNYLLQRGIAPERLMVNYYGDSRSAGRDPGERRVEIEWLR